MRHSLEVKVLYPTTDGGEGLANRKGNSQSPRGGVRRKRIANAWAEVHESDLRRVWWDTTKLMEEVTTQWNLGEAYRALSPKYFAELGLPSLVK